MSRGLAVELSSQHRQKKTYRAQLQGIGVMRYFVWPFVVHQKGVAYGHNQYCLQNSGVRRIFQRGGGSVTSRRHDVRILQLQ